MAQGTVDTELWMLYTTLAEKDATKAVDPPPPSPGVSILNIKAWDGFCQDEDSQLLRPEQGLSQVQEALADS